MVTVNIISVKAKATDVSVLASDKRYYMYIKSYRMQIDRGIIRRGRIKFNYDTINSSV